MKYFLQYRFKVIIIFACYFLAAGLNLVWPYLSGTVLYDEILPGKVSQSEIGRYGFALLMLVLVMVLSKLVQQGVQLVQGTLMAQVVAATVREAGCIFQYGKIVTWIFYKQADRWTYDTCVK